LHVADLRGTEKRKIILGEGGEDNRKPELTIGGWRAKGKKEIRERVAGLWRGGDTPYRFTKRRKKERPRRESRQGQARLVSKQKKKKIKRNAEGKMRENPWRALEKTAKQAPKG